MKKFFTLFTMFMFMAVNSIFADDLTSTWTMNTTDGIAEVTVVKQGTPDTGGDLELSKDGITATSAQGYFKGSGSNGIQIYKTGSLTVTAPENHVIKSIVFKYPKDCYPFVEAVNAGGSSTTKTPSETEVKFTAEAPANSFTFTNNAGGQTKVKKMVITYEEAPAAGWDGTVTTSLDGQVIADINGVEGMSFTFNGASSIIADEEGGYIALVDNEEGWPIHKVWGACFSGCTSVVEGSTITLNGWKSFAEVSAPRMKAKAVVKKAADADSWYLQDFGAFIIDGESVYLDDIAIAHEEQGSSEPFMLTAVENNGIAGNLIGAVEASENGVSYQFNVTAADKNLSNGTAIPTLTLMENASVDFGAASVTAYGSDQAYIRFMSRQEPFFTTPGTYVLSIPEGTFVDADGTPNAAVTLKWVIIQKEEAQPFDITAVVNGADTEAGAEVDALNYNFAITAANAITAVHEGNITLTDASGAQVGGNAYVFGYEGEGGATTVYARFSFDSEDHLLHTAGTYTLNIPAGMFKDAEGGLNNEFSATWTVKEQAAKVPFDITSVTMNWMGEAIESGAEVEALSYMYNVTCDKEGLVAGEGHIEFKDAEGNGIGVGSWNGYYLSFMSFGQEGYKTPGTYTLTIPAGALVDADGNPCNEYTATWTVKEQAEKVPFDITAVTMNWMGETIESGAEVEALSYMYNVTCEKEGLVAGEGHIEFKDAEGNGIGVGSWNGYYLSFMSFGQEGYKTPGTYTLTIPAGALVDAEGNPCNEYTATWTVTGKVLDKSTAEGQITDIQTLLDENKETLGDDYTTFSEELNKISDELAAATTQSEVDEISNKLNTLYGDIQTALNEATGINFATLATKANGKYVKGGQIVIVKNGKLFNTAGQNIK